MGLGLYQGISGEKSRWAKKEMLKISGSQGFIHPSVAVTEFLLLLQSHSVNVFVCHGDPFCGFGALFVTSVHRLGCIHSFTQYTFL